MSWKENIDFDEEGFEDFDGEETEEDKNYDGIDDAVEDINFSELIGKRSFKKAFPKAKAKVKTVSAKKKVIRKKKAIKPLCKNVTVEHKAFIDSKGRRQIAKVLIPRSKKTIVEHVSKFIVSDDFDDYKNIQYHDGNKLKQILLIIDNSNSSTDLDIELFNPSMALDYLYSTRQDINDRISVANSPYVTYRDLLNNILANPLYVYNAKLMFSGPTQTLQKNQSFIIKNKNSQGFYNVSPISVPLFIDNYQIEKNNINIYNFQKVINRPYVADGMDVIQYKVLAGNTVTMCFYSKQILLKKILYKEAQQSKELI